ncbi:MAG: hypothetical protein OEL87_00540 [Nanoarchaeota archaeon]|nr:hypothetical protein [Nanoarchaeota archaeon]
MGGDSAFLNLIRATRVERSLMTLSSVVVVMAFANKYNLDVLILMFCFVIIYSAGSIINAKTDNDFPLKYANTSVFFLFSLAFCLSLANYVIFLAVLSTILMSFIYSKGSRHILFGDSIALALCHRVIPIISAALIVNLDFFTTLKLSGVFFSSLALMTPMKNMNGWKEDLERGYKTLMTVRKDGKLITNYLLQVYFILTLASFFFFDLGKKFLLVIIIMFSLKILMDFYMNCGKEIKAYIMCRLMIILFAFAFVFDKAINPEIILIGLIILLLYVLYLVVNIGDYNGIL